jgi:hypothetical protein
MAEFDKRPPGARQVRTAPKLKVPEDIKRVMRDLNLSNEEWDSIPIRIQSKLIGFFNNPQDSGSDA